MLAKRLLAVFATLVELCELCEEIDVKSFSFSFLELISELDSMLKLDSILESDLKLSKFSSKWALFALHSDTYNI